MMKVNIADLNAGMGREVPFAFVSSATELEAFPDEGAFEGAIEVSGRAVSTGVCFRLEGVIECRKSFSCDRCLEPCTEEQSHSFSEEYRKGDDGMTMDDEANVFSGDVIDITDMVRDTLLAAQPLSNICKEDCQGLCPVCGANLNHGDCGCDRFVPDPRLAALQQFKREND